MPFKNDFKVGEEVHSPCGTGIIRELNPETGDCKIEIKEELLGEEE
jgi:hypothetical protein